VIWGPGDVAKRIWTASYGKDRKIRHIGPNILGDIIRMGPSRSLPPRNARTSKALRSLGFDVQVVV